MEMKSIKFLLAGAAVVLSCAALAETEKVGDYTWTYRLTADGKGAELYGNSGGIATISPDPDGAVTIPAKLGGKPVTSIGEYAFFQCESMTEVTIPATVTSLGEAAFYDCCSLEHIALPAKLTIIGKEAFGTSGLRSVVIPDNVTEIGEGAFWKAQSLEFVQIGKKVDKIGNNAFYCCWCLRNIAFKGNMPTQIAEDRDDVFYEVPANCDVWIQKTAKGWPAVCCGFSTYWKKDLRLVVGDCMVDIPAEAESIGGGSGDVSGGGLYAVGKKVSLKAKADTGSVFCGWLIHDITYDLKTLVSYATTYSGYTVTGEEIKFIGQFASITEDSSTFKIKDCDVCTASDGTLDLPLLGKKNPYVVSLSEPKLTFKNLPTGLKYDAKTFKITGKATKPGVYKVTVSATNLSVKKPITAEWTITVPNFKDDLIKVEDRYGAFIPGYEYNRVIAAATGCTVTGLPTGMKWTAKDITDRNLGAVSANSFYGAATKPGSYTVYFTKTVDKVKHTATATFTVGPFPKLYILKEGNGTGNVTGEGEYPANKKVALKATADKGSVFMGWYDGKTLLSQAASFQYDMPYAGAWITAKFITAQEDKDGVSIEVKEGKYTVALWNKDVSLQPGTPVELPCGVYMEWSLGVSALSQPTVKVSGLPAGLKFTAKDIYDTKQKDLLLVPANTIYGVPTTPSKTKPSEIKINVTTAGKTVVEHTFSAFVTEVPTWAVGQFNGGFDDGYGQATITISAAGKVSGKITDLGGGTVTVSAANFESFTDSPDAEYETRVTEKRGNISALSGVMTLTQTAEDLGTMVFWSYADLNLYNAPWKNEPWKTVAKKFTTTAAKTLTIEGVKDEDGNPGVLTLTFANTGTVTVKGVFTTGTDKNGNPVKYTASGSSMVTPTATIANADAQFDACLYVTLPLKNGKFAGYGEKIVLHWDGEKFSQK